MTTPTTPPAEIETPTRRVPTWSAENLLAGRRPKRWVDDEIAGLDPETDYARIVYLITNYKLNEFVMNLTYATGFMGNTVPPCGSDAIAGTGKADTKPQTRYLDTVDFFWTWFTEGPSSPVVRKSLVRLNRLHAHLYERFPQSFRDNDEWLFTVSNLASGADRMRDMVGAPRQHPYVQTAFHHFWRDITAQLTTPRGEVYAFPDTYQGLIDLAEDYEARTYEYTPTGRRVCEAMIMQFNERFLPRPLHPIGRQFVLSFASPAVRRRHGMENPNPVAQWVFHRMFQALFFGLDHVLPDNPVPMHEVRAAKPYQTWRTSVRSEEKAHPRPVPQHRPDTAREEIR